LASDSGKLARALGFEPFDPWPLEDRLVPTHRQWHRERRAGEPGSPERVRRLPAANPAQM
jgi:dTDP-4-dehydrorhamnose reductase